MCAFPQCAPYLMKNRRAPFIPPLHRHRQHGTPNMAAPISHPQYRAADTIALDNCKIAISTVIVRTVKKYP